MVLYPNKLPESERVCSGICTQPVQIADIMGLGLLEFLESVGIKRMRHMQQLMN